MLSLLIFILIVVAVGIVLVYVADLLLASWQGAPAHLRNIIRAIIILICLLMILQRALPLAGYPSLL